MDLREKLIGLLNICVDDNIELDDGFVGYGAHYANMADYLISHGVTVQEWIPVSEPPKEYRDKYGELIPFLVCEAGTEYPFRALYDGKTWGDGLMPISPTYWMPLPEPPKGD